MTRARVLAWLLVAGAAAVAARADPPPEPRKVTPCDLKADPAAFDRALVEVTGFVSHGFEDFSLFDPGCLPWMGVWVEYGGTTKSGTMYCCGVTADRSRPQPLVVEGVPVPLVEDEAFRRFDALVQRRPAALVHATLVGRFFAGEPRSLPGGESWGGYGHMGCCSLLAVQQVRAVDPEDRTDVDYDPFPDQPHLKKVGCGSRELTGLLPFDQWMAAQRAAEASQPWAFEDPRRVAAEGLATKAAREVPAAALKETRRAQGRIVYEWKPAQQPQTYMVVVSRPFIATVSARDPGRIAWIMTAAYEVSCQPPPRP